MSRGVNFNPGPMPPRRNALWASVGVHLGMLLWVINARTPIFVAPSSGLAGVHGEVVTQLYWSAASGAGETEPHHSSHSVAAATRARLTAPAKSLIKPAPAELAASNAHEGDSSPAEAAQAGASAGNPYGSLSSGSESGHDIRAALPIVTMEPIVDRSQLPGGVEGNCVVEITIDETGAVVGAAVVQSLGAAIDAQVLAAVEHWRFRPATRDGVPIPSKQDVVYHFKPA
jgi:TonB family protein